MAWREAGSLTTLRLQLNTLAPRRSKVSDGGIGDAAHASRNSDHNPWVKDRRGVGVYTARDFTHDPRGGLDCNWLAEELRRNKDPRIKYVIWNGRMFSSYKSKGGVPPWTWRPYTGANKHRKHLHISVNPTNYDVPDQWKLTPGPAPITPSPTPVKLSIAEGDVAVIHGETPGSEEPDITSPDLPAAVQVLHCPECGVGFSPDHARIKDDFCPDCGKVVDAQTEQTATGATHSTQPPRTEVQPTHLKGWQAGVAGFILSNFAAALAWYTEQSQALQIAIIVGGALATSTLIFSVIWLKNQREERAAKKDLKLIETRGPNV